MEHLDLAAMPLLLKMFALREKMRGLV